MQRVDELLHSLREHGTLDSQGEFTVSLSEARRKLKQYHSSEPARYVLLLVSAGFASGGRSAAVTRRDHCLTIRFPGAYLSENELLQALDNPHNSASSAATDLVLGIQGALNHQAQEVKLRVLSQASPSYQWVLRADSEDSQSVSGTCCQLELELSLDRSWSERLRGILAHLGGYAGMSEEERLLDRYGDRCLLPITTNGQAVDRPLVLPVSLAGAIVGDIPHNRLAFPTDHRIDSRRWKGALALGDGAVTLVVHQIAYCQVDSLGVEGTVYWDSLQRDVSREKIVQNEVYQQLLDELQVVRCRLFEVLAGKLDNLRFIEVEKYLPDLVRLYLTKRISRQARTALWNWVVGQFPPEKCEGSTPSVVGLMRLLHLLIPHKIPEIVSEVMEDCADSVAQHHERAHTLIQATLETLRGVGPVDPLTEGYLLLGSGALHTLKSDERNAEKDWFQALKAAWSCPSDRAQELFHTHLAYPADHVAQQSATALRIFARRHSE